jgi:hypothetical protein
MIAAVICLMDRARQVEFKQHGDLALWEAAWLIDVLAQFLDRYGDTIMMGKLPYAAEHMLRIANWSPGLVEEEKQYLRYVLGRTRMKGPEEFMKQLKQTGKGRQILAKWGEMFAEWIAYVEAGRG